MAAELIMRQIVTHEELNFLFGLDMNGRVWRYDLDGQHEGWEPLTMTEVEYEDEDEGEER